MRPHSWGKLKSDRRRRRRSCKEIEQAMVGQSEVECPTCRRAFLPSWDGKDPQRGVLMRCPFCGEMAEVTYIPELLEFRAKAR